MKNFRESLKEELKNPEFKKEWDALEDEFRNARQNLNRRPIPIIGGALRVAMFATKPQREYTANLNSHS